MGFLTVRDNVKIMNVKLGDGYVHQYGLTMKDTEDKAAATSGAPLIKPNYPTLAKSSGVEKQTVQTALSNIY